MRHRTMAELEAALDHIRAAPSDGGTLELLVRRPAVDEREVLDAGELCTRRGLVGDTWSQRPGRDREGPHPDKQLTVMNVRVTRLLAGDDERVPLAGDQLYVDLDLSTDNLPPGTRLRIGTAVIEVTEPPHNGCAKFAARFGRDALRFVNSPTGKQLHLRGINARVVTSGTVPRGAVVTKDPGSARAVG